MNPHVGLRIFRFPSPLPPPIIRLPQRKPPLPLTPIQKKTITVDAEITKFAKESLKQAKETVKIKNIHTHHTVKEKTQEKTGAVPSDIKLIFDTAMKLKQVPPQFIEGKDYINFYESVDDIKKLISEIRTLQSRLNVFNKQKEKSHPEETTTRIHQAIQVLNTLLSNKREALDVKIEETVRNYLKNFNTSFSWESLNEISKNMHEVREFLNEIEVELAKVQGDPLKTADLLAQKEEAEGLLQGYEKDVMVQNEFFALILKDSLIASGTRRLHEFMSKQDIMKLAMELKDKHPNEWAAVAQHYSWQTIACFFLLIASLSLGAIMIEELSLPSKVNKAVEKTYHKVNDWVHQNDIEARKTVLQSIDKQLKGLDEVESILKTSMNDAKAVKYHTPQFEQECRDFESALSSDIAKQRALLTEYKEKRVKNVKSDNVDMERQTVENYQQISTSISSKYTEFMKNTLTPATVQSEIIVKREEIETARGELVDKIGIQKTSLQVRYETAIQKLIGLQSVTEKTTTLRDSLKEVLLELQDIKKTYYEGKDYLTKLQPPPRRGWFGTRDEEH